MEYIIGRLCLRGRKIFAALNALALSSFSIGAFSFVDTHPSQCSAPAIVPPIHSFCQHVTSTIGKERERERVHFQSTWSTNYMGIAFMGVHMMQQLSTLLGSSTRETRCGFYTVVDFRSSGFSFYFFFFSRNYLWLVAREMRVFSKTYVYVFHEEWNSFVILLWFNERSFLSDPLIYYILNCLVKENRYN